MGLASLGTVVLGATLEDASPGQEQGPPGVLRVLGMLLLALTTLGGFSVAKQRSLALHKRRPSAASKASGAWSGLQVAARASCPFIVPAAVCGPWSGA